VTVVEGRVAVFSEGQTPPLAHIPLPDLPVPNLSTPTARPQPAAILLAAGEQVTVTPKSVSQPVQATVSAATAWTQRRLVFRGASLAEVVEEFNRYNARHLVIRDPVQDFHVSGVFASNDPASLIRFLRERPGIRVTETDTEIRITREK
jgi:ferric-dicitrate binding protein FerR (iron transport regulator)